MAPKKRTLASATPPTPKAPKRETENGEDECRTEENGPRDPEPMDLGPLLVSDGSDDETGDEWLVKAEDNKWGQKVPKTNHPCLGRLRFARKCAPPHAYWPPFTANLHCLVRNKRRAG